MAQLVEALRYKSEVLGSVLDGVIGVFHCYNLSGRSTRPLTEIFSGEGGGNHGRCVGLTILPPSCADYLKICELQPAGTLRARPGLYSDCFSFDLLLKKYNVKDNRIVSA